MSRRREQNAGAIQPDVVAAPLADPARAPLDGPTPAEVGKAYIVLQAYQEAVIDACASLERDVLNGDVELVDWIAAIRVRAVMNAPTVELAYQSAVEAMREP